MGDKKTIDRYLTDGLPPAEEDALRDHLRVCDACREYYDAQVTLLRGLSGDPDRVGVGEDARLVGLVLRRAGLATPAAAPEPGPGLWWRLAHPTRPILAFGTAGLALLGLAVLWAVLWADATPVGRINGGRDLTIDGRAVSGKTARGLVVSAGVDVRVGQEGLAELKLARGGLLRLYPGTQLAISDAGQRVDLAAGQVWCQVEPGRGQFRVRTDRAEVAVLGTSFVVEHREADDATEVRVISGEVQVIEQAGRGQVRLRGGQQSTVARGAAPAAPRRYASQRDRADWDRIWDRFVQGWIRAGHKLKQLIQSLE